MKRIFTSFFLLLFMLTSSQYLTAQTCSDGSYQWSDAAAIFESNGCASSSCHGGNASGLDLTSYAGFNTGGTKCADEISAGTTLADIIVSGGVSCADGDIMNAMNSLIASPVSQADLDALQTWIDAGSFEFCPGTPLDDGVCDPVNSVGDLADPGQTTLCNDGSDAITFAAPTGSLPNVQIVVEVNGSLITITDDGSFDNSTLMEGDQVCYTAFTFDLDAINALLTTASQLCPILNCDNTFDLVGVNDAISDLVNGVNDGVPGLNDLQEALDFAGSFGNPIESVQSAGSTLDALNAQIGGLLGNVCYATSQSVCLDVVACGGPNTCPTVYLNDDNLPSLPEALCVGDLLQLCFDMAVDEALFDPNSIEFNYDLLIAGSPATVALTNSYSSGTAIDANATGQICFSATIPAGANACESFELSLEIGSVFYRDEDCPDDFVAYDLLLTSPLPLDQTGDNLNDLIPLLGIAGLNPILVQVYPTPDWTATVTQAPACDGSTLGVVEIYAGDGTLCDTVSDLGTAGADGECPANNAELPEYTYAAFETFIVPDQNDMDSIVVNPCAISVVVPAQTITCVENCGPCTGEEAEVTFSVDMSCSGTDMRPPVVTGPFNSFSGDGNIMEDPDGDDIWEAVICVVPGTAFEYKYAILNFAEQEDLVDDAIAGATCAPVTDFNSFANRQVTIPAGGGALPTDAYGICGTCADPPVNVTFNIDMSCSGIAPGTQMAFFGGFNGFCCALNMTDSDGDNIWSYTLPFPPDDSGCISMQYLYTTANFGEVEAFLSNGEDIANCPNITSDYYSFANRIVEVCEDVVLDEYWNSCAAPAEPAGGCDDGDCANGVETWDGCTCVAGMAGEIPTCDDGDCTNGLETYNEATCSCDPGTPPVDPGCDDGDCTNGLETWDGCECAAGEAPVDPGCDDGDCSNGVETWDGCECVAGTPPADPGCDDGDCSNGVETWNGCECVDGTPGETPDCDDGNCANGLETYNAETCSCDPGTPPDDTCPEDTCFEIYTWDAGTCECIVAVVDFNCDDENECTTDSVDETTCECVNTPIEDCGDVEGCTDACAPNYDATATVDDGSCEAYSSDCNTDCSMGDIEVWNSESCTCEIETIVVSGCTDSNASNFNPDANCDDGTCVDASCVPPTPGEIDCE